MRHLFIALLTAAVCLPSAAVAQDEGSGPETGRAPVGPAPSSPAPLTGEEGALPAEPTGADEERKSRSVATADESIYVIQERAYSKRRKLEITPLFFTSVNNKFVLHFGPGVSLAYHLRENFTIELASALYTVPRYAGMVYEIYDNHSLTPEVVDLKQMKYWGALSAQFSALYGKFEFYGYLLDYDFYASAGFGPVLTVETCQPPGVGDCGEDEGIGRGLKSPDDSNDRLKIAGNLGGGLRVFFSDMLGLRVEIRDVVYGDRAAESGQFTTDIRNNVLVMLGLAILL